MRIFRLINEDGTSMEDYPKNPLEEKWSKKFPKDDVCMLFFKNNIANYSCLNCNKCPDGELFKVPKEDLKVYNEYLKKVKEYNEIHNPTYASIVDKKFTYKFKTNNN